MGRARQPFASVSVVASRRRAQDIFSSVLGEGRGLNGPQRAERELTDPKPFYQTDADGTVTTLYYKDNDQAGGVVHREDGPALVVVSPDGTRSEDWHYHGWHHREGGPACVRIAADGAVVSEHYYTEGNRHRDGGPALIERGADGSTDESYFESGQRHREYGPARVITNAAGLIIDERYYQHGSLDRGDGPAHIIRGADGEIIHESYYIHGRVSWVGGGTPSVATVFPDGSLSHSHYAEGKLHGSPALITTSPEGEVIDERHYMHGQLHREDGPALIVTDANGARTEAYYFRGRLHRTGGPAFVEVSAGGARREEYFRHGEARRRSLRGRAGFTKASGPGDRAAETSPALRAPLNPDELSLAAKNGGPGQP